MGLRGPHRLPKVIRDKRGSFDNRDRPSEPRPAPGAPDLPDWLPERARDIWRLVVPALDSVGMLSKVDQVVLARYCQLVMMWRDAIKVLDEKGYTMVNPDAKVREIKDRPEVKRAIRLSETLMPLERKLGLSPADRANFSMNNPEKAGDPKERFFYPPLRAMNDEEENKD